MSDEIRKEEPAMKPVEAIRSRRSVRTFDGKEFDLMDGKKIIAFSEQVENPYEIPIEWKLLNAKKYGLSSPVISGTDVYITGKMRKVAHAEEAFGYSFEKIVLFAQTLGIGTTWIAGTLNRPAFESAMKLAEGEVMPCVSPLGYPAKRMGIKEMLMRKGVKADTRFEFEKLFFRDSFDNPIKKEEAGDLLLPLEMVRLAPSAVNKQPWRLVVSGETVHFFEERSKGFVAPDGWDLQKVDMGIAMAHFEIGAAECGKRCSLEIAEPAIQLSENMNYVASFKIV